MGPATFEPPPPTPTSPPRPPEPLGQERYKIQFTASRALRDKLREAQALLRHQVPSGDLEEIFSLALTLLVKEARRKKFAEVDRPRSRSKATQRTTRHVPAEIKRAVSARDDGRCAFVAPDGRRCATQDFLEFHHKEPWARSAGHSVQNIELRCRAHNAHAAEQDFGPDFMARFRRPDRSELAPGPVQRDGDPLSRID